MSIEHIRIIFDSDRVIKNYNNRTILKIFQFKLVTYCPYTDSIGI